MLTVIIFATILTVSPITSFFINDTYNGTTGWSVIRHIQTSIPLVIKSNNSLVHILDTQDPNLPLRLESTDFTTTCSVPLKLHYPSRYPRRAISLGNGKIIIWLLNYRLTPYKHLGEWRFVVVEPRNCTDHRDFEIQDSDPRPIDVIGVVPYEDTFDVFITSLTHYVDDDEQSPGRFIYVYRYNDDGEPVSSFIVTAIPDFDSKPFYRPNTIRIHAVKDHDPSNGYFYVQNKPTTYTTLIKLLSSNLKPTPTRTKLKHSQNRAFDFDSYSIGFGNFTVCRYYERQLSMHCSLLDANLQRRCADIVLNYYAARRSRALLVHLNVANTPDGGVVLVYGVKKSYGLTTIYVQRIGPAGVWTTDSISICYVLCDIYDIRTFYVPIDDDGNRNGRYCIVVACDEEVYTRCIKLP